MKHSNESSLMISHQQHHPILTNLSSPTSGQQQQQREKAIMGTLRHEPRHLLYPQRNSPVPSSTGSSSSTVVSALAAQLKNHTSSSVLTGCNTTGQSPASVGGKEPMNNNESMDSGVAGLRDGLTTPHGGSPTSATSSTSSSSHHHHQHNHHNVLNHPHVLSHPTLASQPAVATLPPVHDDGLQYIVDRSKNTTYLKGRFLGKVINQNCFFLFSIFNIVNIIEEYTLVSY